MKRLIMSFLLIASALLFLSLYNDSNILTNASSADQSDDSYNLYEYSYKNITDISIKTGKSNIRIYVDNQLDKIVFKTRGTILSEDISDKCLSIKSTGEQINCIDIYIPDRIYNFTIRAEMSEIELLNDIKGNFNISSDDLKARIKGFCGGVEIAADRGYIYITGGNLQKASTVRIMQEGNIYISSRLTDKSRKYEFYSQNGYIEVDTGKLNEGIVFDVYAISVNGTYSELPLENNEYINCIKVTLEAENGIVTFK